MNENADKNLDNLSRKVMGKSAVKSPSFDFTQTVMAQINSLNSSKVTTYVPLISKPIWFIIAAVFVGVLGYLVFGTSVEQNNWLQNLGLNKIPTFAFKNPFATIELSQTLIYAVVLFAIMLCIQIPILKRHFDKRFEV